MPKLCNVFSSCLTDIKFILWGFLSYLDANNVVKSPILHVSLSGITNFGSKLFIFQKAFFKILVFVIWFRCFLFLHVVDLGSLITKLYINLISMLGEVSSLYKNFGYLPSMLRLRASSKRCLIGCHDYGRKIGPLIVSKNFAGV